MRKGWPFRLPTRVVVAGLVANACLLVGTVPSAAAFDLRRELFGSPKTLFLFIQSLDPGSGEVVLNGFDTQRPTLAFTFDWGDGTSTSGFFSQPHVYSPSRNYVVTVTAHYGGGLTDWAAIVVRFMPPVIAPVALPAGFEVDIPNGPVTLGTRYYPPPILSFFVDSDFAGVPREAVEYVLSVGAAVQKEFVNDNVFRIGGGFSQVVLKDPNFGGAYALWFTNPPAFAAGAPVLTRSIGWSTLFHELGHNFTLNTPARFYYGGRIDGNANAIFSESMAQIFQHATAHQIANTSAAWGLPHDLTLEIELSASASAWIVRESYDRYISSGMPFASWNDPTTAPDETFDTFMTIAYKFLAHAENDGMGYRRPLKRVLRLLQLFQPHLAAQYDRMNDTPEASIFRSTLMVAALSFGFSQDLRPEFRALNFPLDDTIYRHLMVAARRRQIRNRS